MGNRDDGVRPAAAAMTAGAHAATNAMALTAAGAARADDIPRADERARHRRTPVDARAFSGAGR